MLVEKILVHEEDGKLDLDIRLKAPSVTISTSSKMESRQIASPQWILTMTGWVRRSTAIIMRGR